MSDIILCNTGSDSLSRIDTESLIVSNLRLSKGEIPFGPHGLSLYKNNILTANNYNNTISIINAEKFTEERNLYIGAHPNDIAVYENYVYVTCGESNSVIVYDLIDERINFEVPTGRFPHNISILQRERIAFISNMGEESISLIDISKNKVIKKLQVESTPLKIAVSNNYQYLYVCMSYLGYDKEGYIGIISLKNLEMLHRIKVGFSPVDLYEENNYLYVSNLCGRCISIINLNSFKEERKIDINGMPRGIIKDKNMIFVGDYLNGLLNIIDLKEEKIKVIAIGREPNAMTLIS